jgi:hypothetical protein
MSERFITITTPWIPDDEVWLLIKDYRWYMTACVEIEQWCEDCLDRGFRTEGMTIKFANIEERNMFLMRWASGNF